MVDLGLIKKKKRVVVQNLLSHLAKYPKYFSNFSSTRGGEKFLHAGLSERTGLREVFPVGGRFLTGQIVEIGGAARVESVTQVLEKSCAGRSEIFCELNDVLGAVLEGLAGDIGQNFGDFTHGLGLRTGDVVKLVGVALGTCL